MWFERRRRERPGIFRRAAAGAWHVPAGFMFLARTPPLWPLAILPALLAVVCVIGGLALGAYAIPLLEKVLVPGEGKIADRLGFLLTLALWIGTLIAGVVLGLAVALLLSAPILERVSRQVEARVRGLAVQHSRGLGWEMLQSFKGSMYFVLSAPVVLLLSLVPLVGPVVGTLWGAHALAFQQTPGPPLVWGVQVASPANFADTLNLVGTLDVQIVALANTALAAATGGATGAVTQLANHVTTVSTTGEDGKERIRELIWPSVESRRGSLARSGWGISPTTFPASLVMPAMSSMEPLGLSQ